MEGEDVLALAYKYARPLAQKSGVDVDDLAQEAALGILEALGRYDETRGAKLTTFAEHRANGAMLDALRRLDHMTRYQRAEHRHIVRVTKDLRQRLMREPTLEETADAVGASTGRITQMLTPARPVAWPETVAAQPVDYPDVGPLADVLIERAEVDERVRVAVKRLPQQERVVITLCYFGDIVDNDVGKLLGVTESRICQVVNSGLRRLRKILVAKEAA